MTPDHIWSLVIAAGTAIAAMAAFIVKMYADLKAAQRRLNDCQEARIKSAEEYYRAFYRLKEIVAAKKHRRRQDEW